MKPVNNLTVEAQDSNYVVLFKLVHSCRKMFDFTTITKVRLDSCKQ